MSFVTLSPLIRSLFCTWSVIICIGFIINAVLAFNARRKIYMAVSVAGFLFPYFLFQCCAEISDYFLFGRLNAFVKAVTGLPWILFFAAFSLSSIFCVCFMRIEIKYRKTHITPNSVKEASDGLDAGLMFYHENGQPFMVNYKMNELSLALTGKPLLNGNTFSQAINNRRVIELNGRFYRFTQYKFTLEKEPFCEINAEDITELYKKTQKLKADNENLSLNNRLMKEYGERIDDTVRREEILKTKVNIHDEMNRLLLSTDKAIHSDSEEEKQKILETWQKNILLLCIEANSEEKANPLNDIDELARLIGIKIHCNAVPLTQNPAVLRLFVFAAEEAMTNAVKHAEAKNFYINIAENEKMLTADFSNDGTLPTGKISETGGLKNLRERLEKTGGTMEITADNKYNLKINIPTGEIYNGL